MCEHATALLVHTSTRAYWMGVTEERWLDDQEQQAWRGLMAMQDGAAGHAGALRLVAQHSAGEVCLHHVSPALPTTWAGVSASRSKILLAARRAARAASTGLYQQFAGILVSSRWAATQRNGRRGPAGANSASTRG